MAEQMLSRLDRAWIAGFFDGEGCVNISFASQTNKRTATLRITIAQTNREILEFIQQNYGGTISVRNFSNPNWNTAWTLYIGSQKAAIFLRDIYPWLRLKEREADLALEYLSGKASPGGNGRGGLTQTELDREQYYYNAMREMKSDTTYSPCPEPDDMTEDHAWLAGFFDGEGTVNLQHRSLSRGLNQRKQLRLSITQTNFEVLEFISSIHGGSISPVTHANPNYKPSWHYNTASNISLLLLEKIIPYLRLKKEQAELAIQYQYNKPYRGNSRTVLTTDDIIYEESVYNRMRELKHAQVFDQ